ncbi:unnamed protein product [Cunninghamella echinulata]
MNNFPVITSIKVNSYESKKIDIEKLATYLIGLRCSNVGTIHLKLSCGWQFTQRGAIIKPPIRWLHSFEKNASFDIECNVTNNDVAFHKAGIDATLLDEMDDLKKYLNEPKPRILRDAIPVDEKHYKRFFEDGYTDIVPYHQLYQPVYHPKDPSSEIAKFIHDEITPISKMGMGIKLSNINTPKRFIQRPTETIFFLS